MFSRFISKNFFVLCLLIGIFSLVNMQSAQAFSDEAPVFTHIEVKEIAPPADFVNARRYSMSYFYKDENSSRQVYPTLAEKQRDYDLILARAVRIFFEDEYHTKHKGMDEHVVEDADKRTVLDLVSQDFLSKAWSADRQNSLLQFINRHQDRMMLFTLNIYLDYSLPDGSYNYGNDINPILLRFSRTPSCHDDVTFIMVNYSDK